MAKGQLSWVHTADKRSFAVCPSQVLGLCGLGYGCGHTALCAPCCLSCKGHVRVLTREVQVGVQVASAVAGDLRHQANGGGVSSGAVPEGV